jgi:hypothetical protein
VIVQAVPTERKAVFSVAILCTVFGVYQQLPLLPRTDMITVPATQEQADSIHMVHTKRRSYVVYLTTVFSYIICQGWPAKRAYGATPYDSIRTRAARQ